VGRPCSCGDPRPEKLENAFGRCRKEFHAEERKESLAGEQKRGPGQKRRGYKADKSCGRSRRARGEDGLTKEDV